MAALTYPDVRALSHTLKEAVSSAILHETYDRLRGADPFGRVIYREKPAKVLHAQNILPRRRPNPGASSYLEKDDVTKPSHIGTIGMSFQIADRKDRSLSISAKASIYLRVLPTAADLVERPVVFRMARQARSIILRHRREALRQAFEENAAILGDAGRKSEAWRAIQDKASAAARTEALREIGLDVASVAQMGAQETVDSLLNEVDEAPAADDPTTDLVEAAGDEAPTTHDSDISDATASDEDVGDAAASERSGDSLTTFEFVVIPGAPNPPPEVLIEREQIPHKWIRLSVDFGTMRIDLAKDEAGRQTDMANFNRSMSRAVQRTIDAWLADNDPEMGGRLWAFPAGAGTRSHTITAAEVAAWDVTLAALRTVMAKARPAILPALEFEDLEDPLRLDERTIRIILANESDLLEPDNAAARETDSTLYQVELSVRFDPDLHREVRLERIQPSYRYNDYLTHSALGINCGVRRRRLTDAQVLETTALPTYFQPLTEPFKIAPAPRFESLGREDGGIDILHQILAEYDHWLDGVVAERPYGRGLDPIMQPEDYEREKRQFETIDLPGWRGERDAIARGVRIIEQAAASRREGKPPTDPDVLPLTAWRFMNQTFERHWKAKKVSSWRLFQITFILAQLPAIVSRLDRWRNDPTVFRVEDDQEAALLYFSTGGGKSESFFGLLVFSLAFDRLRGKECGITGLVRYPLRLLTSQQAFRLAQVLAAAQRTRWHWKDHGLDLPGREFEIGFWVGGGNTPNYPSARGVGQIPEKSGAWNELAIRHGDYALYRKKWLRLPNCPFCAGSLDGSDGRPHSTVGLRRCRELPEERLAHFCFNKECEWNKRHGATVATGPHPLPIHIMDTDIYAYAPAVLLGTVDKLALIGQNARTIARVLGMFGFPAWQHRDSGRLLSPYTREQFRKGPEASGCVAIWPFYRDGKKLFLDPYPLLEIQDEAHLLDESLGTFSGLFETTFHYALRELAPLLGDRVALLGGRPRPSRIVAASATVTEPERQIDQIYQRIVAVFPKPGADLYESFYARLHSPFSGDAIRDGASNPEHRAPTRRRYVSLMTNGLTHTAATVAVLSAFHLTISARMKGLIEGDDAQRWVVRQAMANALPDDVFQAGHRRALLDPAVGHEQIACAIDLDRIALLYVTNKKGGDNVKAALQDILRRDHRLAGLPEIPGVKTALITGAIDAGLIGGVVTEASTRPPIGTPFTVDSLKSSLRSVIATSAISHGVDVDEFNMMFFAGQPADIAEYIQASSRVGRTHVGTSVLIPTPQQRRDRYIVETHDIFHRFLERMIHAASVERWAEQAISRTLASFLQLKLCGVDYIRSMSAAATGADKAAAAEPDNLGEIGERSRGNHIELVDQLRDFVTAGIGLHHATSPRNKDFYSRRIHDLFDRATTAMERSNWRSEALGAFFAQLHPPLSKPMTSLRDVDEAGIVEGGSGTGADRVKRSDIGKVMTALMRGSNSWGAGEAGE
jgi:hypothetical protein